LQVTEWVNHAGALPASGFARVEVTGHVLGVRSGDTVEIAGEIARPSPARNPGGFDFARFLRDRGQHAVLRSEQPEAVTVLRRREGWFGTGFDPARILERARARCESTLERVLSDDTAALGKGLLLGTRGDIDPELKRDFAESGTAHILAISGANVVILSGLLWVGACLATRSRRVRLALVMLSLFGYLLLTDWQPPVVRSVWMLELWLWGHWRERSHNGWNLLSAAGVAMLAAHPEQLFDTGALLSFLAVGALLEGSKLAARWNRLLAARDTVEERPAPRTGWERAVHVAREGWMSLRRHSIEWYATTLVIWLVTTPLVVSQFHLLSGAGLVVNVILSPITGLILVCGYLTMIAGLTIPPLADLFGPLFDLGLRGLVAIVQFGADIPGGAVYLAGPPVWWVTGFYAALGVWLWRRGPFARRVLIGWLAVPGVWLCLPAGDGELRVSWLSVGHGGATLIETPHGRTLLYDAGRLLDEDRAPEIIQQALWSRGHSRLDAVILSHADIDHFNAVPRLVEVMPPSVIVVHPSFADFGESSVRDAIERWTRAGVPTRFTWSGDTLRIDPEVELTVLAPRAMTRHAKDNENSLTLRVACRGRSILLTGDLEGDGLVELLKLPPERVDVLHAPHHGGVKSNTPDLARWCAPRFVVVAGGGRDTRERLSTIYPEAERVFATRDDGAIIMRVSRTGDLAVETLLGR
jgi:competence protein ComEC